MASPLNKTIRLTAAEKKLAVELLPKKIRPNISGIYHDEIINALNILPRKYFDLVVADPPYNSGRDFGNESDKQNEGDYRDWVMKWVSLLPEVLKADASLYICCDWRQSSLYEDALANAGLIVLNRITWKRDKGRGASKNWKQNMEDIWFAVRDKNNYTFNLEEVKIPKKVIAPYKENGKPKDWYVKEDGTAERMTHPSNIWTDMTVPFWSMPENTEHSTQKPEALIERIIRASSNSGDRILDLFSGSGTTSVVAKRLGRKFIGIEMNPDYVRLGLKRLHMLDTKIK
jgi:site-specific DNA-methyltransferase (adenine-specific)